MDLAEVLLVLFIVVVLMVSLLSNLLVLICFVYSSDIRKQVPGIFIVNLSFCNLLITVVNMPATVLGVVKKQQPFGDCICQTVGFLETFLTTNTMLSMAALSIDKWIAVVFPLSYISKMRHKDAVLMMSYTWLHSLSFPVAAMFFTWLHALARYTVLYVPEGFEGCPLPLQANRHYHHANFGFTGGHPPECETALYRRAKEQKTARNQEDQHFYRVVYCLLCSLCYHQVDRAIVLRVHKLSLGSSEQVPRLLQSGCRPLRLLAATPTVQEGSGQHCQPDIQKRFVPVLWTQQLLGYRERLLPAEKLRSHLSCVVNLSPSVSETWPRGDYMHFLIIPVLRGKLKEPKASVFL
ncbi:uncharacterized protein LOC144597556 isoform X1 [Rhinoraja longicauda]